MDTDATKAPRPDAAWKEVLQDAMDEIVNMAKENYELKEEIKRLEESENRLLNWLTEDCPESVKKQLSNAWIKYKEAKP